MQDDSPDVKLKLLEEQVGLLGGIREGVEVLTRGED
jgi:hypothetical protein